MPHNSDVVRYVESDMNITDGNGVKYLFNGVHETMNDIITRWMCTSICSARYPHPTLVSFQYQTLQNQWEPSAYYNLNDRLVFDERDKDGSPKLYLMEQKAVAITIIKLRQADRQVLPPCPMPIKRAFRAM